MEVTIFKSMTSHVPQYFEVHEVLKRIKNGTNKKLIDEIRSEKNHEKRDLLKKKLIWICFSGKFRKRLNSELIEHSGLICLDFDNFPNIQTLNTWRSKIKKDKFTFALFTSPSGNGLKVLVKIPKCKNNDEHNLRFDALSKYWVKCKYFDNNVKGVSRVCFESYDKDVYINNDSFTYVGISKQEVEPPNSKRVLTEMIDTDSFSVFQKLLTWFESKYNLKKGNRNESLFYLASACRDFNIPKNSAVVMVSNYASKNAEDYQSISKEIPSILKSVYSRPGQNKKMNLLPSVDTAMPQDESIILDDGFTLETLESEIKNKELKEVPDEVIFWKWGSTAYKIDFLALKQFLQDQGFYRYELSEKDFLFVRVIENTIQERDVRHIKDFLLKCLHKWDKPEIYNMIAGNTKFKKEYLNYLDPIEIKWNKDTKEYAWIYFENTAVKISKNKVELVNYIDLEGFIWKSQKLKRNFYPVDKKLFINCDFSKFINNICHGDEHRIKSYRTGIGYLIHGFKNKSTVKAVIFNDEIISEDAMGGTGKGLTMQIIGHMKNVVIIPGADFNTGKEFAWQRINFDTDIVLIDDVEKNFKYKKLFTFLTDGWPVRKLYQDEVFLPPEDSPKIAINTNYTLKGDTDSYARRKFELELYPHYNKNYQPIDDFKREFITEWPKEEQNLCDNYLMFCVQEFFRYGLVEPPYVNLEYKKLVLNTSEDFVSFAESFLTNDTKYSKKDLFIYYKDEHNLKYSEFPTQRIFTKWMEVWGNYNNWKFNSRSGAGGVFFIYGTGENDFSIPGNNTLVF